MASHRQTCSTPHISDMHLYPATLGNQMLHMSIANSTEHAIFPRYQSDKAVLVQMATRGDIADVFSLCFGSVEGDGAMMLGDVDLDPYGVELNYTQLLSSPAHPHYYCVELESIAVADTVLAVAKVSAMLLTLWRLSRVSGGQ